MDRQVIDGEVASFPRENKPAVDAYSVTAGREGKRGIVNGYVTKSRALTVNDK